MKDGFSLFFLMTALKNKVDMSSADFVKALLTAVATALITTFANQRANEARFDEFKESIQNQVTELRMEIRGIRTDLYEPRQGKR